jgi:predicted nucleic acid-binding protein
MTDEALLDTNVLVYAHDRSEPEKQSRAHQILSAMFLRGRANLTTQVVGEFFRIVTQKIAAPVPVGDAYLQVMDLIRTWPVLHVTPMIVLEAARGVRDHHLPFWDAQVWATARLNQISVVLSEDFSDGSVLEGVRFANPFAPTFDLATLR